jgi:protein tyrosine phosphatase (PTP) superfamily phosphohydrolase (DUF442 family)
LDTSTRKRWVRSILATALGFSATATSVFPASPAIANSSATTQSFTNNLIPINDTRLPNARRVTDKIFCGGQPEGDGGFAKLQSLGVKTIISVDGIKPNIELAHKYGMHYVHLPFGYDSVPQEQGEAIAKAMDEMPGPIYVHCHHGKHRSPAAVAVACVDNGTLSPADAESILKSFGTGDNYKGLWKSARDARRIDPATLAGLKVDFVEIAKIRPLADAMVGIDDSFDLLKLTEKAGWKTPPAYPDLDPAHEALQIEEQLHEIGRSDLIKGKSADFKQKLADAEQAAQALRMALTAPNHELANNSLKRVASSCTACHQKYRD